MTRIDFYILDEQDNQARLDFACKLINKTIKLGHRIYVHCESHQQALNLSESLWKFEQHSFLAHNMAEQNPNKEIDTSPIIISHIDNQTDTNSKSPCQHHDLLINLSNKIPEFFASFDRLSEIVIQETRCLDSAREHYRFYQSRNFPLHRHDLRKKAA